VEELILILVDQFHSKLHEKVTINKIKNYEEKKSLTEKYNLKISHHKVHKKKLEKKGYKFFVIKKK